MKAVVYDSKCITSVNTAVKNLILCISKSKRKIYSMACI